jgi:hypothetical protein
MRSQLDITTSQSINKCVRKRAAVDSAHQRDMGDDGLSGRECACLVEHNRVHTGGGLQHVAAADEQPLRSK